VGGALVFAASGRQAGVLQQALPVCSFYSSGATAGVDGGGGTGGIVPDWALVLCMYARVLDAGLPLSARAALAPDASFACGFLAIYLCYIPLPLHVPSVTPGGCHCIAAAFAAPCIFAGDYGFPAIYCYVSVVTHYTMPLPFGA